MSILPFRSVPLSTEIGKYESLLFYREIEDSI